MELVRNIRHVPNHQSFPFLLTLWDRRSFPPVRQSLLDSLRLNCISVGIFSPNIVNEAKQAISKKHEYNHFNYVCSLFIIWAIVLMICHSCNVLLLVEWTSTILTTQMLITGSWPTGTVWESEYHNSLSQPWPWNDLSVKRVKRQKKHIYKCTRGKKVVKQTDWEGLKRREWELCWSQEEIKQRKERCDRVRKHLARRQRQRRRGCLFSPSAPHSSLDRGTALWRGGEGAVPDSHPARPGRSI